MLRRTIRLILVACIITMLLPLEAIATEVPYDGYIYDAWGRSVPSPAGYRPLSVIYGEDIGAGQFQAPTDLFVDGHGRLFVVDGGNNRIVVLNSDLKLEQIITDIAMPDGSKSQFNNPNGIFVTDAGLIYIADTENQRVVAFDESGKVQKVFLKPENEEIRSNMEFKPLKLVVDTADNVYVYAYGVYEGLVSYNEYGEFDGFYGSNKVEITFRVLAMRLWKNILSRQQEEGMVRFVPIEFSNAFIDTEDFIYVSTKGLENATGRISKINPLGINILRHNQEEVQRSGGRIYSKNIFGDVESVTYRTKLLTSKIVDVCVDKDNVIAALDQERGKIFLYDQDSNPLFIFGGQGDQEGVFRQAVAIEKLGENYIVLDGTKNNITVFYPTEYAVMVRDALRYYNDGRYVESMSLWNDVLMRNSGCELAYRSIGKAYLQMNDYKKAMDYLKLGNDRASYSMAFIGYRKDFVRKYVLLIVLGLAIAIFIFIKLIGLILWKLGVHRNRQRIYFS